MAIAPKLEIKQSQSLVMTQTLRQAIEILQLNNIELQDFVEKELEQNPFLEKEENLLSEYEEKREKESNIDDFSDDFSQSTDIFQQEKNDNKIESVGTDIDYDNTTDDSFNDKVDYSNLSQDYDHDNAWDVSIKKSNNYNNDTPSFEETIADDKPSLYKDVEQQIISKFEDNKDRIIAYNILGEIDDNGYFKQDIAIVADKIGCNKNEVSFVLETMKGFDPCGIFAKDLSESLNIQLQEIGKWNPKSEIIIDNLEILAKGDMKKLMKMAKIEDVNELKRIIANIKLLKPKPIADYEIKTAQTIIPDAYLKIDKFGNIKVDLNNNNLPRVLINRSYCSEIKAIATNKEAKKFLNEKVANANWLIKSLHQRANTILKVATEIAEKQKDFFLKGANHLKPMLLKDIAYEIEMHESTVSRVTNNKYIATPRGVYELKFFFSKALASSYGGDDHSSQSVKFRIKDLIDKEDKRKPLSDDKIVQILTNEGINIARRTVSKYRDALNIASSSKRKIKLIT